MKNLIYITFIFLFLSCEGQNKKQSTADKPNIPTSIKHSAMHTQNNYKNLINDKVEYFDIKYFDNHKDEAENLIYTDNFGSEIKIFGDKESGYFNDTTPKNSLFTIHKEYNHKGVIHQKWVNFKNGIGAIGIKYEFDDSGKLIKQTDTDKDFKITPDDIINYCNKNNIDLHNEYTSISRGVDDITKKSTWEIEYRGKYDGKYGSSIIIELEGNTGEIQKVTCINGKHNDSVEILYEKK
ncbi:hypothetical protein [Chryseobacterium sp. ON_d1]|uniref:hypothetical protein n=1 Tax=Chryseobacterium sp. ON_d1 TaxID=2583211 RepID=UPI001156F82F|nr:hypothetical protein [Chryseobacterium sp. ON_d1]GEJ44781.1 hypothetical protein CRS_13890 [Chryseobacterium sp. ON_d1]